MLRNSTHRQEAVNRVLGRWPTKNKSCLPSKRCERAFVRSDAPIQIPWRVFLRRVLTVALQRRRRFVVLEKLDMLTGKGSSSQMVGVLKGCM